MADSSEDDKLQYIKKDYFHPVSRPWFGAPASDDKSTGEDSSNLFMSEPSASEADSSEQHMRLLSPLGSLSGDSDDPDCLPPPQPPPARLLNVPAPNSPGNTSLSSWESPHFDGRQVHIHFTPDRTKIGGQTSPLKFDVATRPIAPADVSQNRDIHNQQLLSNDVKNPGRGFASQQSSNSASLESDGHQQRGAVFLDDLRCQSQGKVQEQSAANSSFESPFQGPGKMPDTQGIIRSKTSMSSIDTAVVQNTSGSDAALAIPMLPTELQHDHSSHADISIVMVLSASDDEGMEGNTASTNDDSHETLDWEQQNATDGEKTSASKEVTPERQRRIRNGHRRQRSGDVAAATLSTGSKEWKGMEQDNIPMPPVPGDHDDEEDKVQDKRRDKGRGGTTSGNDPSPGKGLSADVTARDSAGDDTQFFSNFALGVSGEEPSSRRQSRRQRRDSRARTRYGTPDSEESSNASTSPPGKSRDHPLLRESKGTNDGSSFSGWSEKIKGRKSFNPPSTASNFAGVNPGAERNYSRRSYSHAGEFYNQGFHFGAAGSPTYQAPSMRGQTWNQSPRQDGSNQFQYSQGYSPRSDSGMPLFRRSGTEEDTPLVQNQRKRDEPQDDAPYASNSTASEKFRGVRFEDPILQPTLKTRTSPFANIGRKTSEKADRRSFLPQISATGDETAFPTYLCPACKTRQREFFTVTSAPRQFESPSGYIAVYFGIYVVAALYIFGLQEGWGKLDCFYFAVITLTTAGLGDFVPTSDGAKIICSIFIYFGVACIGLLLGSYIAGMLDENSSRKAMANRIKACPNCGRIQNIKDDAERRAKEYQRSVRAANARHSFEQARCFMSENLSPEPTNKKIKRQHGRRPNTKEMAQSERPGTVDKPSPTSEAKSGKSPPLVRSPRDGVEPKNSPPLAQAVSNNKFSPKTQQRVFGSPMTSEILGRQSHTRHASLDIGSSQFASAFSGIPQSRRRFSGGIPATLQEQGTTVGDTSMWPPQPQPSWDPTLYDRTSGYASDEESSESDETSISDETIEIGPEEKYSSVKNAKYVFITLREALVNSMVIIAFGCMGFYFIEGFSFVDSWYFTTVLLTTVGYGDIVPYTKGGKLFATIYILVAGTILLNNMSMISMIPLELRRRRTELAVLNQFGDSLDDAALRELATGPLIQRLNLSTTHPGGLDECTREMFSLAMMVRLGKVTEEDIKLTFAAFRKLDVHDDGVLNSKSIIAGMIQKRKTLSASYLNLAAMNVQQQQQQPQPIRMESLNNSQSMNSSSWMNSMNSWGNSFSSGYGWFDTPENSNEATNEYSSLVSGQPTDEYGIHQAPLNDVSADSSTRYFSS